VFKHAKPAKCSPLTLILHVQKCDYPNGIYKAGG
jgi:hypothetical protein